MPNQRKRPVKRVVTPGFFGALKDATAAVIDAISPRSIHDRPKVIETGVEGVEERKNAQHRKSGNGPT